MEYVTVLLFIHSLLLLLGVDDLHPCDVTQLMRRYLIDAEYGIHNWPIEYKNEFASLLHNYK